MSGCATVGCEGEPAWPSVRRSLTWCQPCLRDLALARCYEPAEPLTGPKDRWLLTHVACGHQRHSSLGTVRKTDPVCAHCRWTAWAATTRTGVLPGYARAIVAATGAGDLTAALEYAAAYDRNYVWTVERTAELFASADAELLEPPADGDGLDPLDWACMRCGYRTALPPERMLGEVAASWLVCHQCDMDRLHRDPAPLRRYYSLRGLDLLTDAAADRAEAYDAVCRRCHARRRVSVDTLTSGAPPCLQCDGQHLDPASPHRVYLFEFPHLRAYKVGITHTLSDDRLRQHAANGGVLRECVEVLNRAAAVVVERTVLDGFRTFASEATAAHFPQGGWTECWDTLAGRPSLAGLVDTLGLAPPSNEPPIAGRGSSPPTGPA